MKEKTKRQKPLPTVLGRSQDLFVTNWLFSGEGGWMGADTVTRYTHPHIPTIISFSLPQIVLCLPTTLGMYCYCYCILSRSISIKNIS